MKLIKIGDIFINPNHVMYIRGSGDDSSSYRSQIIMRDAKTIYSELSPETVVKFFNFYIGD